jgi:hypothetical protein
VRSVIVGSNRFINCQTLISVKDQPLLQILFSPLRVTSKLPPNLPSGVSFYVVENELKQKGKSGGANPRIVASETNVSIFWSNVLLVSATLLDDETAHLKIDLRRVGINIYDDNAGLHIGNNLLASNSFENCSTAIAVG